MLAAILRLCAVPITNLMVLSPLVAVPVSNHSAFDMSQNVKVISSQSLRASHGKYLVILYEDFVIDLPLNAVPSMTCIYLCMMYTPTRILNVIIIYRALL